MLAWHLPTVRITDRATNTAPTYPKPGAEANAPLEARGRLAAWTLAKASVRVASVATPLCDHAHMVDEVGNGGQSETPPGMERWVLLRSGFARAQLRDQALVLSARGIRHQLLWREARWWLAVPEAQRELASAELGEYACENVPVPRVAPPPKIDSGVVGVVAYLVAIWTVWLLDVNGAFGWDWRSAGRLHVASIADGQAWHVLTALTLHADLGHIAANSLFGAVFGVFAGRCLGSGLAWAAIVLAAAVGNALNALVQPESFQSSSSHFGD